MSHFVYKKIKVTAPNILEDLAERSIEIRKLQKEADSENSHIKRLARLKLDMVEKSILELRQADVNKEIF